MIEKLKTIDYLNVSEDVVDGLITELVELPKDELKECVLFIIDACPDTAEYSTNLIPLFETIEIKVVLDDLMDEYDSI